MAEAPKKTRAILTIVAVLVIIVEATLIDGWILALLLLAVTSLLAVRDYRARRPVDRVVTVIGIVTFVIVVLCNRVNAYVVQRQGERIYAACEAFKNAEGRYPESIEELVPARLHSIPTGKFVYGSRWEYMYRRDSSASPILWLGLGGLTGDFEYFDFKNGTLKRHVN
jgi:hypothetical protein